MAIAPISPAAISGFPGIDRIGSAGSAGSASAPDSGGSSFADALSSALDSVSDAHQKADDLAVQAATGDLNAVHDYTVAATEAQLMTQLTVEIRNRAVDAFNDIMRMQV